MRFDRCRKLFGDDFKKLQSAKVLILGVGGVGGFCLDCLYRSGVHNITIVDNDIFDITNQNRQIGSEAQGSPKVERLSALYPGITPLFEKVTQDWCEKFDFEKFDLVIDAIDDMKAKVAVAKKTYKKLISSSGSARKIDPTLIEYASIWKTHGDALAKKFRYELKKSGFDKDFEVVFSCEPAKCKELGSFVATTGAFGLALCSLAIQKIINPPPPDFLDKTHKIKMNK